MQIFKCRVQAVEVCVASVHWCSRSSLDVELDVSEQCGPGSLSAGMEFGLYGQQDDVVQLQRVQSLEVLQPGGGVLGPQGQGRGAGPDVLLLGGQVMVEECLE